MARPPAGKSHRGQSSGLKRWSIYFIQVGLDGPIKIGKTKGNPLVRMAGLQTGIPFVLRIVAIISPARQALEGELHAKFASLRIMGEWFHPAPDLLDFIKEKAMAWDLARENVPRWWFGPCDTRSSQQIREGLADPTLVQPHRLPDCKPTWTPSQDFVARFLK